jgi:hypothetical protein
MDGCEPPASVPPWQYTLEQERDAPSYAGSAPSLVARPENVTSALPSAVLSM